MQSKKMSLIEAIANTAIAFSVSTAAYAVIMPLMGFNTTMVQNVTIVLIFSAISVVRNFLVRRLFTWIGVRHDAK